MNELTGLHFSPWTERARWALDYHKVPYRYREYTSMLGEPGLRLRSRRAFGKVSVPLLVTPDERIGDSFLIAQFADRQSSRPPLVPTAHCDAIRQWTVDAERALCSARIRATRRLQGSALALAERLPAYIPQALRLPLVPMSWMGAEFILRKYRVEAADEEALLRDMDRFLAQASAALKDREFIFDHFSFADIVVATMMQAVTPVDPHYIDLGAESTKVMCEPELQERYAPLLRWRDDLYARWR